MNASSKLAVRSNKAFAHEDEKKPRFTLYTCQVSYCRKQICPLELDNLKCEYKKNSVCLTEGTYKVSKYWNRGGSKHMIKI